MEITRYRKFSTQSFYPSQMGEPEHHIQNDFCMAVRAGDRIFLRGQTGFDLDGNFRGLNDVAEQTEQACLNIKQLLNEAGSSMDNICKITVYLTDRDYRSQAYAVIAKHFQGVFPCSTGLVVKGLALPEMYVEIDVEAMAAE
ncbi:MULTISPECIES: Rid family hydrolase [unclassified Paenibacillus]|uniref:RidA family protein n=1 Tax=unclassified Paenibacillus TaxID=185978 RepID=UPI00240493AA|nr:MULTISPECIES: Rid family hydrolase [unclassified Paenibacillus]MDF9841639.1 enamine deaminase RidA (YjgF/YER057c/UK114 family) [Paenibacillus sp. PastF-2]MDF9848249.1 enamine deaminase RidA (YjgF/YER057c/UK114 family) [Paenibacillus sp. PastM-2]MDF9854798.1 enamine deaminase RidA (YjgF/YER057c/UK114 family) [Paenibacillus sp. PastF-1]MDH6480068.1 enamine deaminase RidA (YjgF/YER057c/UK114 family) [Paenibacillus sp. PastH-2]MDH6507501.1 enamine deaminase RidA (YjgF/YER057c/UK114 family) [Pae